MMVMISKLCFNPTLVRLRPNLLVVRARTPTAVSIPRWFD